ncbi:MAG TPA: hypothetical protein VGL86_10815 [Polyangia bacterium]
MRAASLALVALALAGCPNLDLDDLVCGAGGACPDGQHCVAATNHCAPGAADDLAADVPGDLGGGSDGGGDDGGAVRLPNSAACAGNSDCLSSFCVDGVCCDQACDGQCQACDVDPGTCTQVTSGQPHGSRAACAGAGSSCGGSCGSSPTACDYPDTSTSCRAQSCANSVETMAATCDGNGACPMAQTSSCGAFKCNGTGCYTTCTAGNTECVAPAVCISGKCQGQLANGTACSGNGDCVSGFCADGYCCNLGCTGQCESCNVTAGSCLQVSGAPAGSRAPCNNDGSGCGGQCGTKRTSCDYPTSQCRAQSCSGSTETFSASCDGNGACPAITTKSCTPYVCGGSACETSCSGDGDCISGDYCNGASGCLSTKPLGRACSSAGECTSGNCVDGVCCDGGCGGPCQQCNSAGHCTSINGAPVHGGCNADPNGAIGCAGSCNGSGAGCVFPGSSTSCKYCNYNLGWHADTGTCDGNGTCNATGSTGCGHYSCSATTKLCYFSCTDNSECNPIYTCQGNVCM